MSAVAAAPSTSPKAKATKPKVPKKAAAHPPYSDMIKKAVTELKEKGGSSKPAILKYLLANYKLGENVIQINAHLRMALKRAVAKGDLKQVKGTGASGSFKLGEKKPKVAKAPKKDAAKKPAVKKASKTTKAAKPASEKKAKSPKKAAAKPKTEKKAKKPKAEKAEKTEKKAKAPKKAAAKPKTEKKAKSPKKATKPKAKKAEAKA